MKNGRLCHEKNKKIIIAVIILACVTLSMCGFKRFAQEAAKTSAKQQEVETVDVSKINNSNFFFEDITNETVYSIRHSFFSDVIPDEMLLQMTTISQYENGNLYLIKCDYDEDFPGRYGLGFDRFSLGYFYIQDNSATIYRIREEDMTNEIMDSEEKIMSAGAVVCQEQEKKIF